jgi:hypothetical protein
MSTIPTNLFLNSQSGGTPHELILVHLLVHRQCVPEKLGVLDSGRYFNAALYFLRSKASSTFSVRLKTFEKETNKVSDFLVTFFNFSLNFV